MKFVLMLVTFLVGYCAAMLCLPDSCKKFKCKSVVTEEDCTQRGMTYIEKGYPCRCCPACVLPKGVDGYNKDHKVKLCEFYFLGLPTFVYRCDDPKFNITTEVNPKDLKAVFKYPNWDN